MLFISIMVPTNTDSQFKRNKKHKSKDNDITKETFS
jgi:hypothetical protein